jgi:hypothetical protein
MHVKNIVVMFSKFEIAWHISICQDLKRILQSISGDSIVRSKTLASRTASIVHNLKKIFNIIGWRVDLLISVSSATVVCTMIR